MLLAAAWQRFSLPLQPLAHADILGFLNPGLQSILGHGFQHTNNRNFLYPGLIYGLLAIFHDFRAITIVQHLFGLGTGVLLLAVWCQVRRILLHPGIPQWIFDLAGLFIMAVYLFATEPRHFEYYIRPDVLCPFFAMLALYSVVRFLIAKKDGQRLGKSLSFGALSIFLAVLIANLKPSFWLTSIFFTIPIWLALFDPQETRAARLLMVIAPMGAAALLIWLPERHFAAADQASDRFLPESLFSIHALIIREQIAADVARPDPSVPYSQDKLRSILAALDAGIAESKAESPHHFQSLGYDADYLLYHPFFAEMAQAEGYQWDFVLQFYKYYYFRAWRERPLEMLHKVTTQLGLFYNLECPAYCDRKFDLRRSYSRSLVVLSDPTIQQTLHWWPPAGRWQEDHAVLVSTAPTIDMNRALRLTINALGHVYLPTLLTFLASLPWILLESGRRARFGIFCAALAIGYSFNFGNNLGIAILHTLEISRYTYVQFATTVWTEMLTFVFLIEALLDGIASRRRGGSETSKSNSQSAMILEGSI